MKLVLTFSFLLALTLSHLVTAATPSGARQAISSHQLKQHVAFLASDSLEGRAAGTRGGQAAAAYLAAQFRRLGLDPAGDDNDYLQEFGSGYRNVLALLPGANPELNDQVILLGGHFDHVGYGRPGNSFGPFGQIHNGADDNASGAAAILEIAEACAQLDERPGRSILFALWDAEEDGLLGSEHWAASPSLPLERVKLVVNLDMIGRLRDERVTIYGTRTAADLRQLVSLANWDSPLTIDFDWTHREDSDHWTFYQRRIPYLMFHTGDHDDYHRPSDDADKLNYDGLERLSRMLFEVARSAATTPSLPGFRSDVLDEKAEQELERSHISPPARLGIAWLPRDGAEDQPIIIARVIDDSPAAEAGLLPGDRIVQFNGLDPKDITDLVGTVLSAPTDVRLLVIRDGDTSPREVPVMLRSNPVRLGVQWRTDSAELETVIITRVIPGSPAERAGIRRSDRVYRTDRSDERLEDWFRSITSTTAGPLRLRIERDGRVQDVSIQLLPVASSASTSAD